MKLVADFHVHTIASGHAYSTVLENAEAAKAKGLELIAITDHGPAMPGGPHPFHFSNLRALPPVIAGVRVLRGAEVNIIDTDGNIDLRGRYLKHLDIVLAGFHRDCIEPGSAEENTRTLIRTMASGLVDIIVHPGNPVFAVNLRQVAEAAAEHNLLLEINNVSLGGIIRRGSRDNCLALAGFVAKLGGKVSLGSDSHFCSRVGELAGAAELAEKAGLKPAQVVNTSLEAIDKFLVLRGRRGLSQ
ncbi:MAG: phosphatase [Eubacteriales bacterium]|nr:phosphatase [Eubacteriales bacterium]